MASPARFTFDLDMASPGGAQRARPPAPGLPEDLVARLVEDARAEGFAEGRRAGAQEAEAMAAQTLASAAATLAARAEQMGLALDAAQAQRSAEAAALAASVGRKLAAHALARYPLAEIEALIAECLASLEAVPHLVIRCHPDLADAVRALATARIETSGFAGRLIVMGDPDQRLADTRLEWVDGGLARDTEAISREIDRRIATYAAARGATPTKETDR